MRMGHLSVEGKLARMVPVCFRLIARRLCVAVRYWMWQIIETTRHTFSGRWRGTHGRERERDKETNLDISDAQQNLRSYFFHRSITFNQFNNNQSKGSNRKIKTFFEWSILHCHWHSHNSYSVERVLPTSGKPPTPKTLCITSDRQTPSGIASRVPSPW